MWTAAQTRSQFAAIAWLRWRILVNGLRRKGGAGELAARIVVYPILAGMAIGPSIGVGIAAFYLTMSNEPGRIALLLWIAFGLCQLLNIQLGQPGSTFDPNELIRFPLGMADYIAVRLFFGLLSPANIVGTAMAFAIALGVTLAQPALGAAAFGALAVFAAANVLFSRMVFAWVDRWLATRRAREIFSALSFAFALGIQWVNFTFNPAYNRQRRASGQPSHAAELLAAAQRLYHHLDPVIAALPPGLTARALVAAAAGHTGGFFGLTLASAGFAALFLAVFALRMRTEFRGEALSDAANAVARTARKPASARPAIAISANTTAPATHARLRLPPVALAQCGKELLYVRRNQGVLYAFIMPIFVAFLVCARWSARSDATWVFPAVLAYVLLGIGTLSYNSFGLEGAGSQFYFLAPVPLKHVLLGKNLVGFGLAGLEAVAVLAITLYLGRVPPLSVALASLLWAAGTLLFGTALGNRRSITAPKKISTARMSRNQASPLSTLLALALMFASAVFAAVLLGVAFWLHLQWLPVPVFALFAAAGLAVYRAGLNSMDRFMLAHREELFTELCKAA